MRFQGLSVVFGIAFQIGCGDGGTATDESGDGDGDDGVAHRCDVYEGRDEFLACVCEDVKPACHGLTSSDCEQVLRSPLKQGQHDGGLECVQALGDLFACEFGLTCAEFEELADYWSTCGGPGPGGRQPYCRRESSALVDSCSIFEPPCGP